MNMKRFIEKVALRYVLRGISGGTIDIIPVNFKDSDILTMHARTFSILYEHGLEYVLAMLEAKTGVLMRKFSDCNSHPEMCRLQGQIDAYLSVREAVDTVIRMERIKQKES